MLSPHPAQQPRPQAPFALASKFSGFFYIAELFALTLLPFVRRGIGYRLLSPSRYIAMFLIVVFGPGYASQIANTILRNIPLIGSSMPYVWIPPSAELCWFTLAALVAALVHRWLSLRALRKGRGRHTGQTGVSHFSFLPLRPDIVRRFVDPGVCLVIGYFIYTNGSHALGTWVMYNSGALYLLEQRYYDWLLGTHFDRFDAIKLSELHVELRISGTPAPAQAPNLTLVSPAAPVVTGLRARACVAAMRAFLRVWQTVVRIRNALSLPPFVPTSPEARFAASVEMALDFMLKHPPTPAQQGSNAAFVTYLNNCSTPPAEATSSVHQAWPR